MGEVGSVKADHDLITLSMGQDGDWDCELTTKPMEFFGEVRVLIDIFDFVLERMRIKPGFFELAVGAGMGCIDCDGRLRQVNLLIVL